MDSTALDIDKAYQFYKKYLLEGARDKADIYREYGFKEPQVASNDWEVFGAILLKDKAKPGDGSDLEMHEIKSAIVGNSFEYQYHKNHGLDKLQEDTTVSHVFISYSRGYGDIEVRFLEGSQLASIFNEWRPEYIKNYQEGRQRFRKSISYGFVQQHGKIIFKVTNGEMNQQEDSEHFQPPML
jgi:hypothetical protein